MDILSEAELSKLGRSFTERETPQFGFLNLRVGAGERDNQGEPTTKDIQYLKLYRGDRGDSLSVTELNRAGSELTIRIPSTEEVGLLLQVTRYMVPDSHVVLCFYTKANELLEASRRRLQEELASVDQLVKLIPSRR